MPSSRAAERTKHIYKLGLVIPRFGEVISGGAELHARWLAERLADAGHAVEIFTSCAIDHHLWTNELPPGTETFGKLLVRRYRLRPRDHGIHGELSRAIQQGKTLSRDEELLWLRHGASSAEMEEDIATRGNEYDAIIAMPYLFGTTYFAYSANPSAVVLIPCLHDEPYAYTSFAREMLGGVRANFFNTEPEAELASTLVDRLAPWAIVGAGVERPPSREPFVLPRRARGRRSLLYVGRREGGKNTPLLIDYFIRYKARRPGDLALFFAGLGDDVPRHPDIFELPGDFRSDDVYNSVFGAGTILCQPSMNESLSLVLLDGWLAGRPALVNGRCAVTRYLCERSNGGLWFSSYAEFEAAVDRLLRTPSLTARLGHNGREFVRREYSWDAVLRRFDAAMDVAASARV